MYPSIHTILSLLHPSSFFHWDAVMLGREAHKWIEDYYKDGIPINTTFPSGEMASAVVQWLGEQEISPYLLENRGYNKRLEYAGTVDFIGKKEKEYYLIDFKFANSLHPSNFIQMEACRRLTHMEEERAPPFAKVLLLQYNKNKKIVEPCYIGENNNKLWKLFTSSLEIWKYRQRMLIKRGKIK